MFSYDCMRILLMMLDCAVVHSTATWVSNSLKGHPLVCNLGLQSFKETYLATVLQSWFIGVRFFKAEICPGSHSLRGYQWSLKDSGVRVGGRIARGIHFPSILIFKSPGQFRRHGTLIFCRCAKVNLVSDMANPARKCD